jgi:hypothetical protein
VCSSEPYRVLLWSPPQRGVPAPQKKASKAGLEALLSNYPSSPGVIDTHAVLE